MVQDKRTDCHIQTILTFFLIGCLGQNLKKYNLTKHEGRKNIVNLVDTIFICRANQL